MMEGNNETDATEATALSDLLSCLVAACLWLACSVSARCGLFVAYGKVSFTTLLRTAQARASAATIGLVYAVCVAFALDGAVWWCMAACSLASCLVAIYFFTGHDSVTRAAVPYLCAGIVACVLPAWWGPDASWRVASHAWIATSAAALACDARSYGRLSVVDSAHLFLHAYTLYAGGLCTEHVHPLLPVAAAAGWLLRALDAIVGSHRRPGSPPAALWGVVTLWDKAIFADSFYALLFVLLGGASGSTGWPALGPCFGVIALATLLLEEHTLALSTAVEPHIVALLERMGWKAPPARGRMARRVRAPARY